MPSWNVSVAICHFGKAAIEAYGVEPFVRKCIDSVFRYTKEWEELTDRVAFQLPGGAIVNALFGQLAAWSLIPMFRFRHRATAQACERPGA